MTPDVAPDRAEIVIEAQVSADLRAIDGRMVLPPALVGLPLVDPLSALPDPETDLQALRTYPGRPDRGVITWTDLGGTVTFHAELPRRYGTIGATGHGLFALGGWYPAVLTPDGLPRAHWRVTVDLPDGTGGALGDVADVDVLRWEGDGERVGLAVVRRPRFTSVEAGPDVDLLAVSRGRPRKGILRPIGKGLALADLGHPLDGIVVIGPLRRRLTGHAAGLAFVSDRAYRLTPGFRFTHRIPVIRGVAAALSGLPDPLERELAAVAITRAYDRRMAQLDALKLLRAFQWVPQIDALLSSQRIPFYSDVLGQVWSGDPVRDDLCEVLDPYAPGTGVAAQLDDAFGRSTADAVGQALLAGDAAGEALAGAGVDPGWLAPWRGPTPDQDYVLAVDDGQITVGRIAGPEVPPETLVVRVNGRDHPMSLAPGYEPLPVDGKVRRVALDPRRHTAQRSRVGDTWPPRYDWTASGWIDDIALTQGQFTAGGFVTLRRQYDTHSVWVGSLSTTAANLVSAEVAYSRREGKLLDASARPHRIRGELGVSLLDPTFYETNGLQFGVDGTVSYAYDDRVSSDFPLRGRRVSVAATAGGIPGTDTTWISASLHGVQVGSPHPRWAVAAESGAAVAQSDLPHRLLVLGGPSALVSVPGLPACTDEVPTGTAAPLVAGVDCLPVATSRGTAAAELRWAPIRGVSVPFGLAWGTELQLTVGVEGLVARVGDEPTWGFGVTAGVYGLGDLLGAEPTGIGVTAGWFVTGGGPGLGALAPSAVPELVLRFGQLF